MQSPQNFGPAFNQSQNQQQQTSSTTTTETRVVQSYVQQQQQPPPQPVVDYSHLLQPSPQQQQIQAPPVDYTSLMLAPSASNNSSNTQNTTTTTTTRYVGWDDGGEARKVAELRGTVALSRFEQQVQQLLRSIFRNCGINEWYNTKKGYLCGCGRHALFHDHIDAFCDLGIVPRVTVVNTFTPLKLHLGGVWSMHPPNVDLHQPMHAVHQQCVRDAANAGYAAPLNHERCDCIQSMGIPVVGAIGAMPPLDFGFRRWYV